MSEQPRTAAGRVLLESLGKYPAMDSSMRLVTKHVLAIATLPRMTERELQQAVLDLARAKGWRCFHPWSSRHSEAGFPDAILIRGERLLAVEFKSEKGKVTPAQHEWLEAFQEVWRVEAMVIRPAPTLDAVERMLA